MTARGMLEPNRALMQRIDAAERRVRSLLLKRQGAIRTAKSDLWVAVTPDTYNTVIDVVALPGRWVATAEASFYVPVAGTDPINIQATMQAFDPETGAELIGSDYDFPVRQLYFGGGAVTALVAPMTITGHFSFVGDGTVRIALVARHFTGVAFEVRDPRLLLQPA